MINFIAAILLLTTFVQGRSGGAPSEACDDIAPEHAPNSPSSDPLPYSIDFRGFTGGEYIPGTTYQSRK